MNAKSLAVLVVQEYVPLWDKMLADPLAGQIPKEVAEQFHRDRDGLLRLSAMLPHRNQHQPGIRYGVEVCLEQHRVLLTKTLHRAPASYADAFASMFTRIVD